MPFTTTIESIRLKIREKDERQQIKDEKKMVKYRGIINERLRCMTTMQENVFFPNGTVHLIQCIADELINDGFEAYIYHNQYSYPKGIRLLIQIPRDIE